MQQPAACLRIATTTLATLVACGQQPLEYVPTEEESVLFAVSAIEEAAPEPAHFARLLAPDSEVDQKQHADYSRYTIVGTRARIDGEAATADVDLLDPQSGRKIGTARWTLVRVGDRWKIQTAPLP